MFYRIEDKLENSREQAYERELQVGFWRRVWTRWLKIAGVIGDFQARVILSLFYVVIVLPFGLGVRVFGDPLKIRRRRETGWTDFAARAETVEEGKRQF